MLQTHRPVLLNWFHSHPSPPVAIISDFFLGWTNDLASQLGIRRVVFSPSGAFAFSVASSLWRDLPKNENGHDDLLVSLPNVPNSPVFPWWQLSHNYRNGKEGDPEWEFFRNNMLANMASWGFVFNSFAELERVYFDNIGKEMGGQRRVWAVGPVLPQEDDDSVGRGGTSSLPSDNVMTWLNSRQDESVIYVCFGSRATLTSAQIYVLTSALEKSQVQFILCVRQNTEEETNHNDDGFEDRVRERGFVIKGWAPQIAILRHRAVGAFLTHCGWNSVLEGMASGVVMLTWPMGADQFTNAKLLVDQLGVGVRVGEGSQMIPESSDLACALVKSLDENRMERVRARKLRDAALDAVKSGGSSDRDLYEFVKCLAEL